MKKTFLLLAIILSAVTASIAQSRFITRGAEEGELYLQTFWYGIYATKQRDVYETLREAIIRFTENGQKAEMVYDEDYFAHQYDVSRMQPCYIMADATPGVIYNQDTYLDPEYYSRTRLWVSFNYGKTWELRDEPTYTSEYFAANAEGLIYRGGGGVYKSENHAESFFKMENVKYIGMESGLGKEEVFYVVAKQGGGVLTHTYDYFRTYTQIPIDDQYVIGALPDVFRGALPGEVYLMSHYADGTPDYRTKVSFSADTGYNFQVVYDKIRGGFFMSDRKAGDFYIATSHKIETTNPWGFYTQICIDHYQNYGKTLMGSYCHDLTPGGVITAIEETNMNSNILVHPNPTTGKTQVTSDALQVAGVEVFDLLGRRVLEQKAEGGKQKEIDISNLPAGIYFVQVKTDQGMITKKIVKQ